MASERKFYPIIPTRTWWDLRRAFSRSLPGEVSPRYLATVLGIQERAAANVMPNLRRVGLIDDGGAPTERAVLWRDDAHYAEICQTIISEVYPKQLTDAAPAPDPDRDRVASWFGRDTRTGSAASTQMARLYLLLAKGDVAGASGPEEAGVAPKTSRSDSVPKAKARTSEGPDKATGVRPRSPQSIEPVVQINLQVQIDASASVEQIDAIFDSMARHLYGRE